MKKLYELTRILAVLAGIFLAYGCPQESKQSPQTSSSVIHTGDEVRIDPGGTNTFVAVDEDSYDNMIKASVAKDEYGMRNLILSGRVFVVAPGTKARILDPGFFKSNVRILSGKHQGKSGWVAFEFVKK